ncbi:hypothetical protein SERLA73DRAFT_148941 [Serpula lacrymans var. lacrymans S7.3]|uniref:Uncharacterized protein n=2 Tax=Serpula lacrymans var. lacrymans TaxID=341189 RepID=F8PGY9_SERL3|nr:uncharacterized protein SERLADRAFT_404547 [Serpula lacrymans var. lacrymans S7.9]EGO04426.1 hypothetical protein SERLA73DRAFT_148941 [Serpula lacrymans var. lacrymans S7.3]EGO30322.1 hypothetical protein SERLADRAFT_404547 [Serpula lacrymans var. lacrymans S7.9]
MSKCTAAKHVPDGVVDGQFKSWVSDRNDILSTLIQTPKKTVKPLWTKIAIKVEPTLNLWIPTHLGHKAMRTYTITQNSFPNLLNLKATSENKSAASLANRMKILQDNQELKAQLLEYVWKGCTQGGARRSIPWMINSGALINASINFKDQTSDVMQPWKNNMFKTLFQSQWWEPKGEERKYRKKDNPYLHNDATLALIECALLGTINNRMIEFSENSFASRWEHYMNLIQEFREHFPTYLASVFGDIEEFVWGDPSTLSLSESSHLIYDFNALEEAARASKQ